MCFHSLQKFFQQLCYRCFCAYDVARRTTSSCGWALLLPGASRKDGYALPARMRCEGVARVEVALRLWAAKILVVHRKWRAGKRMFWGVMSVPLDELRSETKTVFIPKEYFLIAELDWLLKSCFSCSALVGCSSFWIERGLSFELTAGPRAVLSVLAVTKAYILKPWLAPSKADCKVSRAKKLQRRWCCKSVADQLLRE